MAIIYIKPKLDDLKRRSQLDTITNEADEYEYNFLYKAKDITDYVIYLGFYEDIIKSVFEGITSIDRFVKPDKDFILKFHIHVQVLKEFSEETEVLNTLPKFNFDDYGNLDFNIAWMIDNLPQKLQVIEKYRARVQQVFYEICQGDYYYAPYLQDQIKEYKLLIKQHKKKRGLMHISQQLKNTPDLALQFFKSNSKKKRVYQVLKKYFSHTVNIRILSKEADVDEKDIYAIIYQLKRDIGNHKINETLQFDKEHKNGYILSNLTK